MKVTDVRAGWTSVDEIAHRVEERVGIVVGEMPLGRQARRVRAGDRQRSLRLCQHLWELGLVADRGPNIPRNTNVLI